MTQLASPETVLGDFDDTRVEALGEGVSLSRRGDSFFARVPDPQWTGEGAPRYEDREIVLITGQHHMQIYWYETGQARVLGFLPIA